MERAYLNNLTRYDLGTGVEAFTTNRLSGRNIEVILPQHQAHSAYVRKLPDEADDITGVDALITDTPGLRIGVKTADCVGILLHDPVHGAVAAVHSGWRGTVKNIIAAAIDRMREEYGTRGEDLVAAVTPCIHLEQFEVGDEVYRQFADAGYAAMAQRMGMPEAPKRVKWHIDLPAICSRQLEEKGVRQIYVSPDCTYTLHDRYYSARRLGESLGKQRNLNCIMIINEANALPSR